MTDEMSRPPRRQRHNRRSLNRRLLDRWIARRAQPSVRALEAVAHLEPAAVVTGGSRGIGFALAQRFAKAGEDIVLVARNAGPLQDAAAEIEREFGVKAVSIPLDITDADAPQRLDEELARQGYYVDTLVNSAGMGLAGRFETHGEDDVMCLVDLNVMALTRLMRHVLPRMLARGRGGILNLASLGGLAPGPQQAVYYASKAYVISLTEAVAAEIAGEGVRLTALAPGPVNTTFHERMGAEHAFYRYLILPLSPEGAANAGYRGYVLGHRLVVPGLLNMMLALALRILPHRLLSPFIGWLLQPREERPTGKSTENGD